MRAILHAHDRRMRSPLYRGIGVFSLSFLFSLISGQKKPVYNITVVSGVCGGTRNPFRFVNKSRTEALSEAGVPWLEEGTYY